MRIRKNRRCDLKNTTLKKIARLARNCSTKKELATHLKGEELAEAWRIKQVQAKRDINWNLVINNCHYGDGRRYLVPRLRSIYEREGLIRSARKGSKIWPLAHIFGEGFANRIADQIKLAWAYQWHNKNYALSIRHHPTEIKVEHTRSASGYDNFYTSITFNLLQQEAVWIGGLLTIRAKADAGKESYPCWWFERRKEGPGLILRQGNIANFNFHQEPGRRAYRRNLNRVASNPPQGWVTRAWSIKRGNCVPGTDSFIQNRVIPFLRQLGYTVGDLHGAAMRKSTLLEIERSAFTQRL